MGLPSKYHRDFLPGSRVERRQRRRAFLLRVVLPLAVVVAVGTGVLYATIDVDRLSLGRSLAAKTDFFYFDVCDETSAKRWECTVESEGGDTAVEFDIRQTGRRCWTARRTDFRFTNRPVPRTVSGCVSPFETAKGWVGLRPHRYEGR